MYWIANIANPPVMLCLCSSSNRWNFLAVSKTRQRLAKSKNLPMLQLPTWENNTWICLKIGYADMDGLWRLWLISQQTYIIYIRITINWGVPVYPTFLDPNSLHIEIAPPQPISHPSHPKSPVLLSQEVFVEVLKGIFLGGANDPTEVGKWLIDWHGSTRSTQKKLSWCMSLMRVYACIMYLQWQYARLSLIYNCNM